MAGERVELPRADRCDTCRFWRVDPDAPADPEGLEGGECRRYPPCQRPHEPEAPAIFPVTYPDDWCGEWKAANTPAKPAGAAADPWVQFCRRLGVPVWKAFNRSGIRSFDQLAATTHRDRAGWKFIGPGRDAKLQEEMRQAGYEINPDGSFARAI